MKIRLTMMHLQKENMVRLLIGKKIKT